MLSRLPHALTALIDPGRESLQQISVTHWLQRLRMPSWSSGMTGVPGTCCLVASRSWHIALSPTLSANA